MPVRIGVLGAARITPVAVVRPARRLDGVEVVAVAARDPRRAARFAARHRIPEVLDGYEALIADPRIDAVYNPLPNSLHGRWTIAALEAGKHVLCEKPLTAHAAEAEAVAAAAARAGRMVMEAFHYRYHPLARRMGEIARSGELGRIRRIETWCCFPLPLLTNIRYNLALAGGAAMDTGCYAVHLARLLAGEEPEVVSARARLISEGVDRAMTARLAFPAGAVGRVTCSLWSSSVVHLAARVVGDRGEMRVLNPFMPQLGHRLVVRIDGVRRVMRASRRPTYEFQLAAFRDAITRGGPNLTRSSDSIANMRVIDAIYRSAGLMPREAAPPA
jgi:predicted dehydrogenase